MKLFSDIVPPGDTSFKVSMSPWANYTFRVIARNKVGNSYPSEPSTTCSTPPDVPFKNPDNIEGRGTAPDNLVITWTVSCLSARATAARAHARQLLANENNVNLYSL